MRLQENPSLRLRRSPLALTRRIPKKASPGNRERASERACEGARTTARGRERERERERVVSRGTFGTRSVRRSREPARRRLLAWTLSRGDRSASWGTQGTRLLPSGRRCSRRTRHGQAYELWKRHWRSTARNRPGVAPTPLQAGVHGNPTLSRGWAFRSQFLRYVALSTWSL